MSEDETFEKLCRDLSPDGQLTTQKLRQVFNEVELILSRKFPLPEQEIRQMPPEVNPNNNENEEDKIVLDYLGLQSKDVEDPENLDVADLFPTGIVNSLDNEPNLHAIFRTFFPDNDINENKNNNQDENTKINKENNGIFMNGEKPEAEASTAPPSNNSIKRPSQPTFGEKKLPVKKARTSI